MALIDRLPSSEAADAAADALERLIGHEVQFSIGAPVVAEPDASLLPQGGTRSVALPFGNGIVGEVTLVVADQFATAMEAAVDDASLVSAALPALQAAADAIEPSIHIQAVADYAGEISTETLLTSVVGDFVIVPVLENDERIACVVVRVVDDQPAAAPVQSLSPPAAPDIPAPQPIAAAPAAPQMGITVPVSPPVVSSGSNEIHLHEFQMLGDGNGIASHPRPLPLLNDVELEIIAELGSRQMKVRDLVALEPGSVVELDRAAGSPVDVMVNGALLARGEVVVIDEEFGIRLSEIIIGDN